MEQLYHIHVNNRYDDQYYEGNIIHVGDEPNAFRNAFFNRSCSYLDKIVKNPDGRDRYIYQDLEDVLNIEKFNQLDVAKQLEVLETIKSYIQHSKTDTRELLLEEVRKDMYPNLPSRYSCMWLTDKDCIPFWEDMLRTKERPYQIFEVEPNGKIFVSTDDLLPEGHHPHNFQYEEAMHYWNPSRYDLEKNTREYLFEGDLKLTKRVK